MIKEGDLVKIVDIHTQDSYYLNKELYIGQQGLVQMIDYDDVPVGYVSAEVALINNIYAISNRPFFFAVTLVSVDETT